MSYTSFKEDSLKRARWWLSRLFSFPGGVARASLAPWGRGRCPPRTGALHRRATHTHPLPLRWADVDTTTHLISTSVGCGRESQSLENTHLDVGRTTNVPRDSAPSRGSILFFINEHYDKMTLNKTTFLEDHYSYFQDHPLFCLWGNRNRKAKWLA